MKSSRLCTFGAALLAVLATVGVADAQLNLVPNGDFETAGGADWVFAGVGAGPTFPATGGNPGGHGTIDQTAGGWGGVLVAEDATLGLSLSSLGLVAGNNYDFSFDMISLGSGGEVAGMKMESWDATSLLGDTGDVTFTSTTSWDTYTVNYTLDASAVGVKFVPLMVGQGVGSSVGFDNVGVIVPVPEPGSIAILGLGALGLITRRRRS